MRGKLPPSVNYHTSTRNIPAYAGKTGGGCSGCGEGAEHPRVCGENPSPPSLPESSHGTSPCMRGNLQICKPVDNGNRNIPVYAGKTYAGLAGRHRRTEHPRVCGENTAEKAEWFKPGGTSPRMRGKLPISDICAITRRNIPAYAGKTIS